MHSKSPVLWIVATPLGNPGDLSPRAKEVLVGADLVLAEDTRRAGKLFERLGLPAAGFMSFHEHNEQARLGTVLQRLEHGDQVALIADAGTPLVADPGYRLVRHCRAAGFSVRPVPGPSAPITALMASGLPPYPFAFLGFLPRKASQQRAVWQQYQGLSCTLVFFERKSRLQETLAVAASELGRRELCLARELTKTHEEFIVTRLERWEEIGEELRGELTVLIGPAEPQTATPEEARAYLLRAQESGGRPKEIVRNAQQHLHGWSTKALYEMLLHQQGKE
ncbi:MAG: 16S rRNA (cytidine(1402)-2'-O)-methyltransferase [Thermodesulfobacteriota bacterium]